MPITETVLIKAAGSGLMRTIGFPLKEAYNVTDVTTLRLMNSGTPLAATFTVGARWRGLPSDTSKALKWVHVTFKDTNTPRNLNVVDTGGTNPAQTNPLVVTNNTNDITVSNGVITSVFNKVTDAANLITSFLIGGSEVLHATNKPQLTVPTEKKTRTTYPGSDSTVFAATPTDNSVKVANASIFSVGDTVKFAWEGTVANYFPTSSSGPFIIMASPFTIPDLTRALRTGTYGMHIILDYGGSNTVVPIDFSDSQGFNLLSPPPITPTAGMKIRFQEVENATTKTIQSINTSTNVITFTATIGQYIPQGVDLAPTVAGGSSTAQASIVSGGTVVEKAYGDKAVIIKQTCVLKDQGSRIENNLTFEIRHWLYADTGFVRSRITLRNTVQTLSTASCPSILFKALNFDFPTAAAATGVSDSVVDMATSVSRYKANNLHSTLNHSGISNFQWAIHEFQVQWPNKTSVDATGCHFEIFPASEGPISFEGGVIKSRNFCWGVNAGNGLALLDSLGATFDPAYVALSGAVRPNMVEKRDWSTFFASEPQKFKDACARFERIVSCFYDITQAEASFTTRPAMSLYEYRWDYCERAGAQGSYPFGWSRWGNTPDDVGFGNNRFDLPYILFREGLREGTLAKAELAFKLGLQQIRNRTELGQHWTHQSQATGTPDMYGLARYERAYAPDPFNYTNAPIANPTHSWNEGTCLAWALTDDPLLYEAAQAGVAQARQYDYQGTANALLYGTGSPQMGTDSNGGSGAEARFVGWPIHTLITGYRYFGVAGDLTKAQQYTQSFIATLANEPVQDGFIYFRSGPTITPLFQHGGYCVMGMIETWRESVGSTKTAIGDYIVKVAKFLTRGDAQSSTVTANAPMLGAGQPHPSDVTKYNPASHMPMSFLRNYATTLSGGINTSVTTIPVTSASTFNLNLNVKRGILIPAGQLNNPSTWEWFTYTGVSGNNLTGVGRGYSGSGAKSFAAGDLVYPTGMNGIENDLVIATIIMGARISGDATLQQFAQKIWEDNSLYSKMVDGGNPDFVTVGTYQPINLWPRNVSSNGLKSMAQASISLSEFLGDRVNPPNGPSLASISPSAAPAGAPQFTITVNGANFASDAKVVWNSTQLTTTVVSSTQLTAIVPAGLVAAAGTANVSVLNVTDNLTSSGQTFTIAAAPTLSSIAPTSATVGAANTTLTLTGTGFTSLSKVFFGQTELVTTFVSSTQLTAVIPTGILALAGTRAVKVQTVNGLSGAQTFTINAAAAPTITGLSPASVNAGSPNTNVTITGTGFTNGGAIAAGVGLAGITGASLNFAVDTPTRANRLAAINTVGAKRTRVNIYPFDYWDFTNSVPLTSVADARLLQCAQANITPIILFEYYVNDPNPIGNYNKWFAIGAAYAARYKPGGTYWTSQGVSNFGVTVFQAINEPDNGVAGSFIDATAYKNALEGLADGVHSVDAALKVIPGGFATPNSEGAGGNHTMHGYGPALAPLWNNGKLAGIDLHTYYGYWAPIVSGGPITGGFVRSAQADFDAVIAACGISVPIEFYATEFNVRWVDSDTPNTTTEITTGYQQTLAALLLTGLWDHMSVIGAGGQPATQFALAWEADLLNSGDPYGLFTAVGPATLTPKSQMLQRVLALTDGMEFFQRDPRVSGLHILQGNGKKMWVWQNRNTWTNTPGTTITLTGIPANALRIEVHGWDGLRQTINLSGQTSLPITSLPTNETLMFVAYLPTGPSQAKWDGNNRTTSFVSPTQLTVAIPSTDLTTNGSHSVTVTNPDGQSSGGSTFLVTTAPTPTISAISPNSVIAGGAQFTLTVNGSNFASDAEVRINGSARATTFINSTQLTAVIPAGDIVAAGTLAVTVRNVSTGIVSSGSTLTVVAANPAPTVSALVPASVVAGAAQFTLEVQGTNFISSSVVRINGVDRNTTYVDSTRLTCTILASEVSAAGTIAVRVFNPTPGGGLSGTLTLTITAANPVPSVANISPTSVTAGAGQTVLTVNGANFINGSVVRWNGSDLATTFVSSSQLTAVLPANLLTTAGSANVTVFTPTPGGGQSAAVTFTINPAGPGAPTIGSVSPNTATAGVPTGSITITGTNLTGASVTVDGVSVTPTSLSASQLVLPSQTFASAGSKVIAVTTGGGTANVTLIVTAAAPSIATVSPTGVLAGAAQFTLTLSGQNFVSGAVVRVNGSPRTTQFISATSLTATIPASDVAVAVVLSITVLNPDSQASNAISFPVNAVNTPTISSLLPPSVSPGSPAFTLAVLGANFTPQSQIQIGGVARSTTFVSASRLETLVAALEVASAGTLSVSVTTAGVGTSATVNLPVSSASVNLPKLTPAFRAGKATLRVEQGKTFQAPIKVTVGDSIVDLMNVTAVLQLRRKVADEEIGVAPLLELTAANGGLVIDPVNGYITINMTAIQTAALRFARCLFEIEATTPEGITVGILRGDVRVTREVVR